MAEKFEIGKEHGYYRYSSMMEPQNKKIRQILLRLDYNVTYTQKGDCYEVDILV